ncbi:MAG: hypothetical protein ABSF64_22105 [Bryobacteraceae bacterium]|jgi:hypothetical protein
MRAKHVAWTLAIIPVLHGQAPMPGNPKIQVQILVDISGSVKHVNPLKIAADLVGRLDDCNGVHDGSVLYEIDLMAGHVEQTLPSRQPEAEKRVSELARQLDAFRSRQRDKVAGFNREDLRKTNFSKAFEAVGKFLNTGRDIPRKAVWLITDGEHDPRDEGPREDAPFRHLLENASVPFDLFLIYTGTKERMPSVRDEWEKATSPKDPLGRAQAPWIHFVLEEDEDANNLKHIEKELIDRAIIQPVFTLEDADCTVEPSERGDSSLHIVAMTKMDPSLINTGYPTFAQACWDGGRNCTPLTIGPTSTLPAFNPLGVGFQLRLDGLPPEIPPPSFTLDLQRPDGFHSSPWIWRTLVCHPPPWMSLDWWTGSPSWVVNPTFRAEFQAVDTARPENSITLPVTAVIGRQMGEAAICNVVHNGTTEDLRVGRPVRFSGPVTVLCALPGRQSLWFPGSQPFPVSFQLNDTTPIPIVPRWKGSDDDSRYYLRFVWFGWIECVLLLVVVFFWLAVFLCKSKWKTTKWKVFKWENLCFAFAVFSFAAIRFLEKGDVLETLKSPLYDSSICKLYWIEWLAASVIALGCILCSREVRKTHPRISIALVGIPFAFALVGFGLLAIGGLFAEEFIIDFSLDKLGTHDLTGPPENPPAAQAAPAAG